MELFEGRPKLFKNRDILSPLYVPDTIQDREEELAEISMYLGYIIDGSIPPHLLIVGSPGSGKTVCIKYALNKLRKYGKIPVSYAVADGTAYQIITILARTLGCDVAKKGLGFTEIWSVFEKKIEDSRTIIVLDEIDKMLMKDGSKLLYHLSRLEKEDKPWLCVIGLSNKLTVMEMIDDLRVTSSFKPRKIMFSPYNAIQLEEILEYRVKRAFDRHDILDGAVVPLCAALAAQRNGDARYALDLISFATDVCIRSGRDRVTENDVRFAKDEVEVEFIRRSIERLSESQKILLYCILTSKDTTPTGIYKLYNETVLKFGTNTLTHRWLSELGRELELFGLVEIKRKGRGKGKGVDWLYYPPSTIDKEIMLEAIRRSL